MKNLKKAVLTFIPTITLFIMLPLTAVAHDPSLHVKKAEKADCSNMDHSKMDMNDPVAIAMMKKCMKQAKAAKTEMKGMDHSDMSKMDHSRMKTNEHKH